MQVSYDGKIQNCNKVKIQKCFYAYYNKYLFCHKSDFHKNMLFGMNFSKYVDEF